MGDFRYDLRFGEAGENLVKNLLLTEEDSLTVEVKRDRMVSITGNIAIEIAYKGNPSGIMKSEATWWAYILAGGDYRDELIIFITAERLRKLALRHKEQNGTVFGGDGKQSELVLLPVQEILGALK